MGPGLEIGYMYQHFGVFFLEVWTWDDEYEDVPPEALAEMAGVSSVDELGKPWQYTFKPGLLIIIVLIGGFVAFKMLTKGGDEGDGEAAET